MAIQNRRGNIAEFDPSKMLPGEFAYSLDTEELYYCVAPGNVKRCATKEDIIETLETNQEAYDGLQQLLTELESETVATGILNDISDLITKTNKNENDIIKINNRHIGTNLAIDTSQYFKSIDFVSDTTYLSPTGLSSLKAGDTITLSAYLSDISVESVALQIEFSDSGDLGVGVATGDFVSADGLYTLTTTIPEGSAVGDIYAVLPSSQTVTGALKLKNLKLEAGSLVTPWKPSIYRIPTLEYKIDSHLAESAPHSDAQNLQANSTNEATSAINAPLKSAGGLGVAKNIFFNDAQLRYFKSGNVLPNATFEIVLERGFFLAMISNTAQSTPSYHNTGLYLISSRDSFGAVQLIGLQSFSNDSAKMPFAVSKNLNTLVITNTSASTTIMQATIISTGLI